MVWQEVINKPIKRWSFEWNGSDEQIRGHFTPEQRKKFGMKIMGEGSKCFMYIKTLNGDICVKPGCRIMWKEWSEDGLEVYGIQPGVFGDGYEFTGKEREWLDAEGFPSMPGETECSGSG
jgi:hypothetical protein